MEYKKCTKCQKRKSLDEFPWQNKAKGKKHGQCKICQRKRSKQHFLDNKDSYHKRIKVYKKELAETNRQNVLDYWKEHPCVDCGETHPATLQFDHKGNKKMPVAKMIASYPWATVKAEIEKCDVRCANCHMKKTAKEQNWFSK